MTTKTLSAETDNLPQSAASVDPGQFTFYTRHSHDAENFSLIFDEHRRADGEQLMIARLHLHKADAATLNNALQFWQAIHPHVTCPIFTTLPIEQGEAAAALFGFKPLQRVLCSDNTERQLYLHSV